MIVCSAHGLMGSQVRSALSRRIRRRDFRQMPVRPSRLCKVPSYSNGFATGRCFTMSSHEQAQDTQIAVARAVKHSMDRRTEDRIVRLGLNSTPSDQRQVLFLDLHIHKRDQSYPPTQSIIIPLEEKLVNARTYQICTAHEAALDWLQIIELNLVRLRIVSSTTHPTKQHYPTHKSTSFAYE